MQFVLNARIKFTAKTRGNAVNIVKKALLAKDPRDIIKLQEKEYISFYEVKPIPVVKGQVRMF